MAFVKTWSPTQQTEGHYTCKIGAPEVKYADSTTKCPLCGSLLRVLMNAGALRVMRVVRVLDGGSGGSWPFIGDVFDAKTHTLLSCRGCRVAFSSLKDK